MRNDSLYRLGGGAAVLGAVLFALGILLHASQPMTLAALAALPMGPWMASHWLLAIGAIIMAGGLTAFARHLSRTAGEGWSVLGLATTIATAAVVVAVVAPEIVAFDVLRTQSADPGAQHAYLAVNLYVLSLSHVAGAFFWLGVGFFALAMLKDASWPRGLVMSGIAVAAINVAATWVVQSFTVTKILFIIGAAWLVIAGILFYGFAGRMPGEKTGVSAPAGAYRPGEGVPTR